MDHSSFLYETASNQFQMISPKGENDKEDIMDNLWAGGSKGKMTQERKSHDDQQRISPGRRSPSPI
jgi:hypothetical protein